MNQEYGFTREVLGALEVESVRAHLRSLGWVFDGAYGLADVFCFPEEKQAEVLLPQRQDLSDFASRMFDLIQTLAVIHEKPPWDVLHELQSPDGDRLRYRAIAGSVRSGVIPLTNGLDLFTQAIKSMRAAACSVVQPRAVFMQMGFTQVDEFIKSCVLGQTEAASYAINIISPMTRVNKETTMPLFVEDHDEELFRLEPFPRKVSISLMKGLSMVNKGILGRSIDMIADSVNEGVSANLCEALTEMRPFGEQSSLDIEVSWSAARPVLPGAPPRKVSFRHQDFELIRRAGEKLRGDSVVRNAKIEGYILGLSSEFNFTEGERGTIKISRTDEQGAGLVKAKLGEADYARACDAHKNNQRVAITGKLFKDASMKNAELREYLRFEVFPDEKA